MKQVEKTPLGVWSSELSHELCEKIIAEGTTLISQKATLDSGRVIDTSVRDGNVSWFPLNHWVDKLVSYYVHEANQINDWNFNITQRESVQFSIYRKGDFYTWHRDCCIEKEHQRKISVSVQLSDYNSYSGGELEFKDYWGTQELQMPEAGKQKGSILVFPSSLSHQVTPIKSGTRASLVQWYSGPPFT